MGTYNDAATLPATLDSVLCQDFPDFEIIVVNDGSTDPRMEEILQEYTRQHSRIRLVAKPNEGLTRALIDGCAIVQGEYVARIDAGDVMLSGRLAAQAQVLDEHEECAFVSCWTEFCGPQWEPLWLTKGGPESAEPLAVLPDDPRQGLLGDIPHHGSVMFRRSAYERVCGYRPEFYFGQDWDLWYRLAETGSYQVVPHALYRARFFPTSISMMRKRFQDEVARCSLGAFVARRLGEEESVWLQRAQACRPDSFAQGKCNDTAGQEPGLYFIGEALRRRGDPRARPYLVKAMRQAPTSPRAYVRWLQSWFPAGAGQA